MKILYFSFLALVFLGTLSVNEAFSQQSTEAKQNQIADWSQMFPEIPNCERVIQPITRKSEVLEQVAIYKWANAENNGNENYGGCGLITLRFEPSARESARKDSDIVLPPRRQFKIKTFDAYGDSPLCGNDIWAGSITVFFDKDKVLIVSANRGATQILGFARNADYELMKKSMDELVKNKA